MTNTQRTFPETLTEALPLTQAEHGSRVRSIAAGLADLGVGAGDRVAIMLVNRPESNLFDTALLHLGATPISVPDNFAPQQIAHLLNDSGAAVVATESQFVPRLREAGLDAVKFVITLEGSAEDADPDDRVFLSLEELESNPAPDFDFDES